MKNTLKHVFAIALTIALVFALAAPAFADGGKITVMDPGSAEYEAYKIFDVVEVGGELEYRVTDPWKTAIQNALNNNEVSGLRFEEVEAQGTEGEAGYVPAYTKVVKLPNFKAADFATWAKDYATDANSDPSVASTKVAMDTVDGAMVTVSGSPAEAAAVANGYYLVVSKESGATQDRASLVTVFNNDVAVQNKNDMPFDKKVDVDGEWKDESGVAVGDTLNFQIKGKVPDLPADQASYFYLVNDKMDEGLTFQGPVTVTIGGDTVTLTEVHNMDDLVGNSIFYHDDGFDLSLDMLADGVDADEEILITYQAIVNEKAVGVISENFATLTYGDENSTHVKESETKHYTSKILIDKYETGSPETKVAGAKFVLRNEDGKYYHHKTITAAQAAVEDDPSTSDVDESRPAQPEVWEVEWVDAPASTPATAADWEAAGITVATTTAEGAAEFPGLADGAYELIEVEAPTGYTLVTTPIPVTVDGSASTAVGLDEARIALALTEIVNVNNTPGTLLPSTGGIGTTIFYIGGGLLVLAAVVVILIVSRKKQAKAN